MSSSACAQDIWCSFLLFPFKPFPSTAIPAPNAKCCRHGAEVFLPPIFSLQWLWLTGTRLDVLNTQEQNRVIFCLTELSNTLYLEYFAESGPWLRRHRSTCKLQLFVPVAAEGTQGHLSFTEASFLLRLLRSYSVYTEQWHLLSSTPTGSLAESPQCKVLQAGACPVVLCGWELMWCGTR